MKTKQEGKWIECGQGTLQLPTSGASITTEVVELDGFGRIFEVYHYGNEPDRTQKLILAAPDLLEALQACVDRMAVLQEHTNYPLAWPRVLAEAAIAKAKGKA